MFPVCQTCDESGFTLEPSATGIGQFEQRCDDCGGLGVLIPEELVEVAVNAWDADVKRMWDTDEYDDANWMAGRMRRVLAAVVAYQKENP